MYPLTEVSYPAGNTDTFTFDDNGNRTEWARSSDATVSYIYNAADQLTQSTEGTVGTSYTHDNNGNMTGKTTGGVTRSYAFDAFDRLTSVTEGMSSIQSMTYGPDSKRLSLTDSSGTRKFFYDGDDVIQEYDSNWSTVRKEYTHGPWIDEPLSMTDKTAKQAGDTYYLMKDRLGSIIDILDENETLKTTYSYDAFGEPTTTYHSGQVDCMYRFTGRVYDGAMGNYFYRARYYNQSLGRFFSRDPIFSLQSLYAYCGNSPANYTDAMGMASHSVQADAGDIGTICGYFPFVWIWYCTGFRISITIRSSKPINKWGVTGSCLVGIGGCLAIMGSGGSLLLIGAGACGIGAGLCGIKAAGGMSMPPGLLGEMMYGTAFQFQGDVFGDALSGVMAGLEADMAGLQREVDNIGLEAGGRLVTGGRPAGLTDPSGSSTGSCIEDWSGHPKQGSKDFGGLAEPFGQHRSVGPVLL